MNPALEIWLIVARELRKNLRSAKGILLFVFSLLGGTGLSLLLLKLEELKRGRLGDVPPEALRAFREEAIAQGYGQETAKSLANAPAVLLLALSITLLLRPPLLSL